MARRALDPWRDAPTDELGDQVLPRWFALLAVVMVLLAVGVLVGAFVAFGSDDIPPTARRPPPAGGYTHDVGGVRVGDREPVTLDPAPCTQLEGIRIAASGADRAALVAGLSALCELDRGIAGFAEDGGVVRFAQFADTRVDSAARPGLILLNNRFAVTEPAWIAPLVVHDLATLDGDPASAETALAARQAEAAACDALLATDDRSRACDDAAAVVALDDPLAVLRAAGYR